MSAATIVDVARAAGVSKTTASDALSGRGRVSDATREAVSSAAARLGYTINKSARSLRTATTGAIGLYVPQVLFRSEYYLSFVYGVVRQAADAGYDVTLMAGTEPVPAYAPHVDGLVLCDPVDSDPMVNRLMATGLPVVTCERYPGDVTPAGVVWSDHGRYVSQVFDQMAEAGSNRLALLASTTVSDWALTIQETYRAWCERSSREPLMIEVPFGADVTTLVEAVDVLLDNNPDVDSLVCAADGVAAAIMPSIVRHGFTIGDDFLLASCVDSSAMEFAHPPITAIDTKGGDAGAECARLLFDVLSGASESGTVHELALEVHTRSSTKRRIA
ncbi:LacI family DNA-binding transcriptional regulator [Diaminobutyricibacter sp. McL0608]|uniref:LacI family DNA-binding transcriptional regulator n=1 Tax=Leifsonia sp. McL0608 TaxID=3143537 RepID=UPI0031F2DCCC